MQFLEDAGTSRGIPVLHPSSILMSKSVVNSKPSDLPHPKGSGEISGCFSSLVQAASVMKDAIPLLHVELVLHHL